LKSAEYFIGHSGHSQLHGAKSSLLFKETNRHFLVSRIQPTLLSRHP
jgi:hypothetical protein